MVFAVTMMLLAVILGAFGAHALKKVLDPSAIESFRTGVRYQMIHALVILIFAQASFEWLKNRKVVMILFKLGIILFSFSIYGLTIGKAIGMEGLAKALGPITPLGGLSLIIGWSLLLVSFIKQGDSY